MRGYLLDTNILAYWYDNKRPEHGRVVEHIDRLDPDTPVRVSAISWGEIEYGHRSNGDADVHGQFEAIVRERFPGILPVQHSTSVHYGEIRARLFAKFAPRDGRRKLRPCQLLDPVTATTLGIQENDLWIAAQAIERRLVLVTHDKMGRLKEVASDLLDFEDWTT